jgi:ligand-binding SRPBCC domain-containing protein
MADHVLERRLWLPRPPREVFAFFADPRHLQALQPGLIWVVEPPECLAAWSVLDFRVPVLGLPTRWRVFVREWDPPYRFVEAALRGPLPRWEHRHRFLQGPDHPGGPPGTWVEDRVTYRVPLGPLGALAHALAGRWQVERLFAERERRLRVRLG